MPTFSSYRKTAVVVGALLILCTTATILSTVPTAGLLDAPDYLSRLASHDGRVVARALIEFVWAISGAGIAIALYPVLRKHSRTLALAAVAARAVETVLVLVGTLSLLTLLHVSQEFVAAGSINGSSHQAIGSTLLAARDWAQGFLALLAWLTGALMYYYLLYTTRLVPRWLSGWGLVGAGLCLASTVYSGFAQETGFTTINLALNIPIGLQELALGAWLIAKGFSPAALTSGRAANEKRGGAAVSTAPLSNQTA